MRGLILFFLILCSCSSHAQLPDVNASFLAINTDPQVIHLKKNHIKVPSGGHLQGIQAISDSQIIVTGSSSSYAYYLTANRTEFTSVQKLSDSPFRHAGGCQVMNTFLFVGVEDNIAKDRSQILMAGYFYPSEGPQAFPVANRNGVFKRSTAGAVGVTRTSESALLAVGDWDSKNIDFYKPSPIKTPGKINPWNFDSLSTFLVPDSMKWYSYQSLNLLTDTAGKIYLIGFALDGLNNRADLYEVDLTTPNQLKLISTRNFHCKGGAGFRYGSGIYIKEGRLFIYSIARNVTERTAVNIF